MQATTVDALVKDSEFHLELCLIAGRPGLDRVIEHTRIQKYALAFVGYTRFVHRNRVQILGNTEISFLASLGQAERKAGAEVYAGLGPPCVIVTKGLEPPTELVAACEQQGVPLLVTPLVTSELISNLQAFLIERLAPFASVHGVLLDVFGIGVVLLGRSGVGKSECALDLVLRGHRLVADDIVHVKRRGPDVVYGYPSELLKHHMEVRGLGVLNIKDLFGIAAVRDRKRIELVVELEEWHDAAEYDRLGLEERVHTLLDVELPLIVVPVRPGRNISSILEVAARNQLLKFEGHYSARQFEERLNRVLASRRLARFKATDIE